MRSWRSVINCLQRYQEEKKVAAVTTATLEGVSSKPGMHSLGADYNPSPPVGSIIEIRSKPSDNQPTAPPAFNPAFSPARLATNPLPGNEQSVIGDEGLLESEGEQLEDEAAQYHHEEVLITAAGAPSKQGHPKRLPAIQRIDWLSIQKEAISNKDYDTCSAITDIDFQAFAVSYTPNAAAGMTATYHPVYWKLLSQLRATVNDCGLHREPAKQMLNYIWGSGLLLPEDIKGIMRMIMTQSQLMLWQAHWHELSDCFAVTP